MPSALAFCSEMADRSEFGVWLVEKISPCLRKTNSCQHTYTHIKPWYSKNPDRVVDPSHIKHQYRHSHQYKYDTFHQHSSLWKQPDFSIESPWAGKTSLKSIEKETPLVCSSFFQRKQARCDKNSAINSADVQTVLGLRVPSSIPKTKDLSNFREKGKNRISERELHNTYLPSQSSLFRS